MCSGAKRRAVAAALAVVVIAAVLQGPCAVDPIAFKYVPPHTTSKYLSMNVVVTCECC